MPRLQLSKSSLNRQTDRLRTYRRFLPSLDLKRQELLTQRARARQSLAATEAEIDLVLDRVGYELPMLSNDRLDLHGLIRIEAITIDEENIMGTCLPKLGEIRFEVRKYSFLSKPEWVDGVVDRLHRMLSLKVRAMIEKKRLHLLDSAVLKITQRVNLFDKVLIPKTRDNIQRIQIHLADAERAAVIRAKLAKQKKQREALG